MDKSQQDVTPEVLDKSRTAAGQSISAPVSGCAELSCATEVTGAEVLSCPESQERAAGQDAQLSPENQDCQNAFSDGQHLEDSEDDLLCVKGAIGAGAANESNATSGAAGGVGTVKAASAECAGEADGSAEASAGSGEGASVQERARPRWLSPECEQVVPRWRGNREQGLTGFKERGKLKLFLGAAPGVGKTYAMLGEAQEKYLLGADVVIGWLDTHGSSQTQALLGSIPVLERLNEVVQGQHFECLDVQAIIERDPDIVVIDDLATTNPAHCARNKRYQDIDEILAHGISVYSALNIQHLESLSSIVSRLINLEHLETVPDSVFEHADEIRFIDLAPNDLICRLKSGLVYLSPAQLKVKEQYFNTSSLTILRELALRYMANRVDRDAKLYRNVSARDAVDNTKFGLLLVLEYKTDLGAIREAARIAHSLSGGWHCIFIKKHQLNDSQSHILNEMLHYAHSLGAITDIVVGSYAQAVGGYARRHNLSIVALVSTSRTRFAWQSRLLKENAPELNILSLNYQAQTPGIKERLANLYRRRPGKSLGIWQVIVGNLLLSAVFYPIFGLVHRTNFAMGYLMLTFYFSVRYGTIAASLSAIISIFCFDLWSVEPRGSLVISDIQYFWSFMTMLIVGLVAARLIAHRQEMTFEANKREQQTRMLYDAARDMSPATDERDVFNIIVRVMHNDLGIECEFWRYDEPSDELIRQHNKLKGVNDKIVRWCVDNKQEAGIATNSFVQTQYLYLPLVSSHKILGVAVLNLAETQQWLDPNTKRMILALIALTSQTLERLQSVEKARQTMMNMEASRLRNSLLQSLSHDLRTPLTSVMNNAETLVSKINKKDYDASLREAKELFDSTQRLVRLTGNLIEMARLQNEVVTLKKTWFPPEELIGMAKASLKDRLKHFEVITKIEPDCPLFYGDPVLLERVVANILDNATKYCAEGSTICIEASKHDNMVKLDISDSGPGLPDDKQRLFEPFKRGQKEGTISGVGLGLAICKNIAQVHHGHIEAHNSPLGGACFSLTLPIVEPPELDDEELMLQKIEASDPIATMPHQYAPLAALAATSSTSSAGRTSSTSSAGCTSSTSSVNSAASVAADTASVVAGPTASSAPAGASAGASSGAAARTAAEPATGVASHRATGAGLGSASSALTATAPSLLPPEIFAPEQEREPEEELKGNDFESLLELDERDKLIIESLTSLESHPQAQSSTVPSLDDIWQQKEGRKKGKYDDLIIG